MENQQEYKLSGLCGITSTECQYAQDPTQNTQFSRFNHILAAGIVILVKDWCSPLSMFAKNEGNETRWYNWENSESIVSSLSSSKYI